MRNDDDVDSASSMATEEGLEFQFESNRSRQHQQRVPSTNNETNYLLLVRPFKKRPALSLQFLLSDICFSSPSFYLLAVSGRFWRIVVMLVTMLGLFLMKMDLPWFICLPHSILFLVSIFWRGREELHNSRILSRGGHERWPWVGRNVVLQCTQKFIQLTSNLLVFGLKENFSLHFSWLHFGCTWPLLKDDRSRIT